MWYCCRQFPTRFVVGWTKLQKCSSVDFLGTTSSRRQKSWEESLLYLVNYFDYRLRFGGIFRETNPWLYCFHSIPDSKVHGVNLGPIWVLSAPDGPHVGPMNLAIRDITPGHGQLIVRESWTSLRISISSDTLAHCKVKERVGICFAKTL